jgi:hypothetical protein
MRPWLLTGIEATHPRLKPENEKGECKHGESNSGW